MWKNKIKPIEEYTQMILKNNFDIEFLMFENFNEIYNLIIQYKRTIINAVNGINNDHQCLLTKSIHYKDVIISKKKRY